MPEMIAEQNITVAISQQALPIECLTAGEGSPLLLLHGVGDSAYAWQGIIPLLARTYKVYAPSFPGFGTSSKPATQYSPEYFTEFVTAFLDTLELEQVNVIGNSLGGLVAMRFALNNPSRVTSLVLIDSAGLGREITLALRLLTLPITGKLVKTLFSTPLGARLWALSVSGLILAQVNSLSRRWSDRLYNMARDPGYLEATVATVKSGNTLAGQRKDEILLDQLSSLTMPTLLIWGQRDRIVPVHQAQAAISHLRQGQLEILPDCGHAPQIEQPEQVAQIISEFFHRH